MVGDRLDTDIAFGKAFGMSTTLVLTGAVLHCGDVSGILKSLAGVHGTSDIRQGQGICPDFVLSSVGDLAVLATE